ncbi:MAG: UTP--glucose-1-phosphate uridylyltransferase [Xanthomonadales bacterium]|nr:UTP--glucose-1-phosphate uridylyltransferase [Xanthomonadales bacterium]
MHAAEPVRKAVFPVAGLGTRFLPATKAIPKEMLPVVDRPLIQYAAEEAIAAGIDTLVLVTRGDKQSISDHLRPSARLERYLDSGEHRELLDAVNSIVPPGVRIEEAVQAQPLGLGHAVLCAREAVGDEPFAVILPDDLVHPGCLDQLLALYHATGASVVGVQEIDQALSRQYGVAAVDEQAGGHLRIREIVEKPEPEQAPSSLGVVGRYVLTPRIFDLLSSLGAGAGGEIQLTDAIAGLLEAEPVMACAFTGRRFDCGQRLGWIQATLALALEDRELAEPLQAYLHQLAARSRGMD